MNFHCRMSNVSKLHTSLLLQRNANNGIELRLNLTGTMAAIGIALVYVQRYPFNTFGPSLDALSTSCGSRQRAECPAGRQQIMHRHEDNVHPAITICCHRSKHDRDRLLSGGRGCLYSPTFALSKDHWKKKKNTELK